LPLCLAVQELCITQANAQGTCSASPSSLSFPQTGGGPQTVVFTCQGNLQNSAGDAYSTPQGEGPFSFSDDDYPTESFHGLGNLNCSNEIDYYIYISSTDDNGDHYSYVTVNNAGMTGLGCQIPQPGDVPNGLAAPNPADPQGTTNEPISTGNGNYYYEHTDLTISGLVPLSFSRTYNSQDTYAGALGTNWTHSYNFTLGVNSTGAVAKWGDGHGEKYTLSGGVYVSAPGVTSTLSFSSVPTPEWTLTRKDGSQLVFEPSGKLRYLRDRNGNTTWLTYDANWNLTSVYGSISEATLTLSYDPSGRITQVVDNLNRTVSYSYDGNGNLISETDSVGNITKYAYDSSKRLTSIILPNGDVLVQNKYDSSSRVISQTNARG
jgi:YD repeat-containing protein